MKHLLFFLLLYAGIARAQTLPLALSTKAAPTLSYPGNPVSVSVALSGTVASLTVVGYYDAGPARLPAHLQPTSLSVTGGLRISWTGAQSLSLIAIAPTPYLEIRSAGVTIATAYVRFAYVSSPVSGTLPTINVSTITAADLDNATAPLLSSLSSHTANTGNPHGTTAGQVGALPLSYSATVAAITAAQNTSIAANASALTTKADKATTIGGYGITDAYTRTQVDSQTATQNARDAGQDTQITSKLPASYSATQAGTDATQNAAIAGKLDTGTYTTNRATDTGIVTTLSQSVAEQNYATTTLALAASLPPNRSWVVVKVVDTYFIKLSSGLLPLLISDLITP